MSFLVSKDSGKSRLEENMESGEKEHYSGRAEEITIWPKRGEPLSCNGHIKLCFTVDKDLVVLVACDQLISIYFSCNVGAC